VARELAQIPDEGERQAVDRAISALPRGDVEPLKDRKLRGAYRLKVDDWRVLFMMNRLKRTITVVRVAPRDSAYDPLPTRVKRWTDR
jgi:mRNA-degrading endonuclease RelE of RelBE toxin-antitoxin system